MTEQNNSIAGYNDAMSDFSGSHCMTLKQHNTSFAKQLEKLNKVRESLYSTNGWSSKNVNQTSKWTFVDMENDGQQMVTDNNIQDHHSYKVGVNLWDATGTQTQINQYSNVLNRYPCIYPCHLNQFGIIKPMIQSNDENVNLTLRLQLETLNLNTGNP